MDHRIGFGLVIACVAICAGIAGKKVDWASYGEATPPSRQVHDNRIVSDVKIVLGGINVSSQEAEFEWSQYKDVSLEAMSPPKWFRTQTQFGNKTRSQVGSNKSLGERSAAIRIEIRRQSSISPGYAIASMIGSPATCKQNGQLNWKSRIWIPQVPGQYLVCVVLVTNNRNKPASERIEETMIASFMLRVVPGASASTTG